MATAWSITKYRDPEKLDISVLGKAMQYKQQMYDTNVAQVQQLVNQYAGTDLLRDVDKQYFGERLNTIVNYINESGTREWSKKNIATDIQNYASNALDKNVLSAIGSTQAYRKQVAEIEDIKKNKPDQYSLQNEWFATRDLQRYMSSNQIGDTYRAQSYVPYTDVKALLLENSKQLKEFGVEYHVDPVGGNQYFTKIGTFERIDPETAKGFLGMMMDAKVMNQLYIDGQYSFKDLPAETIKQQYDSKLNAYTKYNNERINELKTQALTATRDQKTQIQTGIQRLEDSNNNINKTKAMEVSRDSMANYLYNSDFMDKWTDFLSYDRLKDWKIDDSGFKMYEAEQKQLQQSWENQFAVKKFEYQQGKDANEYQLELMKMDNQLKIAGLKRNKDGSISADTANPNSGFVVTPTGEVLGDEQRDNGFLSTEKAYNQNATILNSTVVNEINELLQRPENADVKKALGNNYNAKQAAWMMVNTPSISKGLYNLLSDSSKGIVDNLISNKAALHDADKNLDAVVKDMTELGNAMTSPNTKSTTKYNFVASSLGYTIDSKGNTVEGNVLDSKGKYGDLARTITALNYQIMSGDLNEVEMAKYKRAAKTQLLKSGMSQKQAQDAYDKMVYKTGYAGTGGFFKQVANEFASEVLQGAQGLANITLYRDSAKKATFADEFKKNYIAGESFYASKRLDTGLKQMFLPNSSPSQLGDSDVDRSKMSFAPSEINTRSLKQMEAIDNKLNNYTKTFNKAVNIDLGSKTGKLLAGEFKALVPVGSEVQKDGNVQVILDQTTGMARVTIPVKDGKEYAPITVDVGIANLPKTILQGVKLDDQNSLYSATNPYSVKFQNKVELPANREEWASKVKFLPYEERTQAFNNPPDTQQDIINRLTTAYGSEIVDKNRTEINKILDTPVEVSTQSKNGQWTLIAKQNGEPIYMRDTGEQTYTPKLMEIHSNAIMTESIMRRIQEVLGNPNTTRR